MVLPLIGTCLEGQLFRGENGIDASLSCGYRSTTPGGENWTVRVDGKLLAATVRRNQLWLGWTAAREYPDGSVVWPQPHIQYDAFRTA